MGRDFRFWSSLLEFACVLRAVRVRFLYSAYWNTQEEILSRHFQSNQMRLINICGVNFSALAWGFAPETLETTLHVRKRIPGSALHPALGQPGPLLLKVAEVVPTKLL